MALSYQYTTPIQPSPIIPAQLDTLIDRRVCVHSGPIYITGRLHRAPNGAYSVAVSEGLVAYGEARVYLESIKTISYSKDTLTPDGVVAYIYL